MRFYSVESHPIERRKLLDVSRVNPAIRHVEYAVRGALAVRAEQLRAELERGVKHSFAKIVNCNIGNPQQLGQKPITFFRQVSALIEYPELLDIDTLPFAPDVKDRARKLLKSMGGNLGAYSHSQGIPAIRESVAKFIEERDGYPSNPNDIFLTAGASLGVQLVLQTIIEHPNVGIMIPIPQYPLYTASIALFDGVNVPYYLDENNSWTCSVRELKNSLSCARAKDIDVRAICVINPGNPTGQVLSEENIRDIIEFCRNENLAILADEVYQKNAYLPDQLPFHSFKKVLKSMGPKYKDMELISFHSVSKGMIGECGRRGGYFECHGISQEVKDLFYKVASISLCPPVSGQIMVDLMVNPPKKGDPSYALFAEETTSIYGSLKRRAESLVDAFNRLEGITCNQVQGALYLFPQVRIPKRAVQEASAKGKMADEAYCMELLNSTGVCMVPGSGFGQKDGSWHFRTTFLPPEEEIEEFVNRFTEFHENYMKRYRDEV